MERKHLMHLALAIIFRYLLLLAKTGLFYNRVEISTPLNSFKRIKEGVFLIKHGIDPYSGDMVHEGPLLLLAHAWILEKIPQYMPYIYICIDLLTGILLYKMTTKFLIDKLAAQKSEESSFAKGTKDLQWQPEDVETISKHVFLTYIFNPFIILNCASLTTTVFSNFFLALYFYYLAQKKLIPSLFFLALETVRSLYPFALIAPVILVFSTKSIMRMGAIVACFISLCVFVCLVNYSLLGSWSFLNGSLGFIFFYGDLQPNVGLFWYFFTEMFEHFRTMFLITFQMNATMLYLIPLSLRLRKDPLILATILTSLMSIFKSYPCLGDVGFYIALLPIWRRCWKFMAHNFVVFCFFLVTTLIMPALWYLWIYAGSANANFYFGATLAFSTGQIFLVTDLLFAYIKREFCLKNGQKLFIEGKEAKIILD